MNSVFAWCVCTCRCVNVCGTMNMCVSREDVALQEPESESVCDRPREGHGSVVRDDVADAILALLTSAAAKRQNV